MVCVGDALHLVRNSSLIISNLVSRKVIPVTSKVVLEMGAASGLPSITACLYGARLVIATDYNDPLIISVLRKNCESNVPDGCKRNLTILGHTWGIDVPALKQACGDGAVDVIICADCIWMVHEHDNLLDSILSVMKSSTMVYIAAGLHTGHDVIQSFLKRSEERGLQFKQIAAVRVPETCMLGSYIDCDLLDPSITIGLNTFKDVREIDDTMAERKNWILVYQGDKR